MQVIRVKDVWKKYKIYHDKGNTLKERVLFKNRNRHDDRWVLKNITFDINQGETVGLIGENGSGKSTLLKLLTRIIYPNQGEIEITGKVSSLLELGAGFHPDMTGRENIYMNASIFGLSKEEIDKKLEQIIDFSELSDYIDSPVRTYSSGMYMRLAFSVAINVEPDILLIDEILAVGDVNFQRKCYYKMRDIKNRGVTIVIVTHDHSVVEKLCDKAIWIDEGEVRMIDAPKPCINAYLQNMAEKQERLAALHSSSQTTVDSSALTEDNNGALTDSEGTDRTDDHNRWGSREVEIVKVALEGIKSSSKHVFTSGEPVRITAEFKVNSNVTEPVFGVGIFNQEGISCYGTNTAIDDIKIKELTDSGTIEFSIDELLLVEGRYTLDVAVHAEDGRAYDYQKSCYEFEVVSEKKDIGVCRLKHTWTLR